MEVLMRFVSFKQNNNTAIGVLAPDQKTVVDLTKHGFPPDLTLLIEMGEEGLRMAQKAIQEGVHIPASDIKIMAPFPRPRRNVICVGKKLFRTFKGVRKERI